MIDGHNRYEICEWLGIEYEVQQMEFPDRRGALVWIILNQFVRRNLPAYERAKLALLLKPMLAEKAKENQLRKPADFVLQNSAKQTPIDTREELAKVAGVSHDTIAKVAKIEAKVTDEVKVKLTSGRSGQRADWRRSAGVAGGGQSGGRDGEREHDSTMNTILSRSGKMPFSDIGPSIVLVVSSCSGFWLFIG